MSSISEEVILFENKNQLWNLKIQDVFIWELIRLDVFLQIQELHSSEKFVPTSSKSQSFRIKIKRFISNLFRSPFLGKKVDEIIFESSRKYKISDNSYADLYTSFLKDDNFVKNALTIETTFDIDNFDYKKSHIDSLNFISKLLRSFVKITYNSTEIHEIKKLETLLKDNFGLLIDLKETIRTKILHFKSEELVFHWLLKLRKPKKVFFIGYNRFSALVSACKKLNVDSIEVQHGLILKESLIYHFPNVSKGALNYFPNSFVLWKEFPYNTGELPVCTKNIKYINKSHLTYMVEKFSNIKKEKKSILIVSQPMHSTGILDFIKSNLLSLREYNIYYKIHPMEFNKLGLNDDLTDLSKFGNIKIIKNEMSIYELLQKVSFVLGVYSTTLFEASLFNCEIFVLDIDSNHYTDSLRDKPNVSFIYPDTNLVDYLELKK